MKKYESHEFYCSICGKRGIPISRQYGFQHKSLHKKKLYCLNCKRETNHIECKDARDVEIFKENFKKGLYKDE